ncbi:MAG: HAD family hydrolase [Candidatus Nanopelagicales bacterium]|jgi:HAD superfamily hydrolase (TIGR01509 family)
MSPLRAVVFDQDGTLIDTFLPALTAYSSAVGRTITLAELEPVAHLGAARNLVSALLGREATEAEDDRFHEALAEAVRGIDPYPGVVELLVALRDAGVRTGVATNSDGRSAAVVLGAHGLVEHFDTVVTVDLVTAPKPDPASIMLAVSRLGVAPGEVAYVGDAPSDMVAARVAGVMGVAAGWGHQAGAIDPASTDHWLDQPADLLDLIAGG